MREHQALDGMDGWEHQTLECYVLENHRKMAEQHCDFQKKIRKKENRRCQSQMLERHRKILLQHRMVLCVIYWAIQMGGEKRKKIEKEEDEMQRQMVLKVTGWGKWIKMGWPARGEKRYH
jgi:uncharacterized membrane protein YwzB